MHAFATVSKAVIPTKLTINHFLRLNKVKFKELDNISRLSKTKNLTFLFIIDSYL